MVIMIVLHAVILGGPGRNVTVAYNTRLTYRCATIRGYNLTWHVRFGDVIPRVVNVTNPRWYRRLWRDYQLNVTYFPHWSSELTFVMKEEINWGSVYCLATKKSNSVLGPNVIQSVTVYIDGRGTC